MCMEQVISSRQWLFVLVEGYDECVALADWLGTLEFRVGNDVMNRGMECGSVWDETPMEMYNSQETSILQTVLGGVSPGVSRGGLGTHGWNVVPMKWNFRNTGNTIEMVERYAVIFNWVKSMRRCWSCSLGEQLKSMMSSKYAKQISRCLSISSVIRWKVWSALPKPYYMKVN